MNDAIIRPRQGMQEPIFIQSFSGHHDTMAPVYRGEGATDVMYRIPVVEEIPRAAVIADDIGLAEYISLQNGFSRYTGGQDPVYRCEALGADVSTRYNIDLLDAKSHKTVLRADFSKNRILTFGGIWLTGMERFWFISETAQAFTSSANLEDAMHLLARKTTYMTRMPLTVRVWGHEVGTASPYQWVRS